MKLFKVLSMSIFITFAAGQVFAQNAGIGTTKGGATGQVSASIAKVVSQKTDIKMRTQPMAGTQKYIPAVNAGSLEFGISNIMQLTWSVTGTSLSKGHPNKNLKMVATLMQFRNGVVVTADSGINSVPDLKGKRIPSEFKAAPLFRELMSGFLANAKLTWDDVNKVPVSGLRQHWDLFSERKFDAIIAVAGTGYMNLVSKKVGGIKFISLDDSPGGLERLLNVLPKISIQTINPKKGLTGVNEPTKMLIFDYTLFANKDVPDDMVYKVAKALYDNPEDLKASSPLWRLNFRPDRMAKDVGYAYHPGAVKFYKEMGVWKR